MPQHRIEIFTAGCPLCDDAVQLVRDLACEHCDVQVLDLKTDIAQGKAEQYGVTRVPAVVVDGVLADCCQSKGVDAEALRALGVGTPA